jgi:hypothetical protein
MDRDLTLWLRRVEAPHGFTAKVLKEVESPHFIAERLAALYRRPALAAVVLLLLLLPLGDRLYQRHRQAQAAARQFALAMRLTQEAFQDALHDAGRQVATHRRGRTTE